MEEFDYATINSPSEYYSEYLDLDQMKKVRFEAVSATNAMLLLEYSDDKLTTKITTEIPMGANKYVSYAVDRKMRYVRYHVKAIEEGKSFKITFTGKVIPLSTSWFW